MGDVDDELHLVLIELALEQIGHLVLEVLDDFIELLDQELQLLDIVVVQHANLLLDALEFDELEEFLHKLVKLGEDVAVLVEIKLFTLGLLVQFLFSHVLRALLLLVELNALHEHGHQVLNGALIPDIAELIVALHDVLLAVLDHLGSQLEEEQGHTLLV